MLPEALLLDQDGTLIDSEPLWEQAEAEMMRSLGGELTRDMREKMIGGPLRTTIDIILEATGANRDPQELEIQLVSEVARLVQSGGVPWMPGVHSLFDRMNAAGVPLGLVTSSWRQIADGVAQAAPEPGFARIVTGEDIARPKPEPDAYVKAARLFGADIRRCVAVEDSLTGIRSALASGAIVVVIPGVVDVPASPAYSRVTCLDDVSIELLEALMAGERFDLL